MSERRKRYYRILFLSAALWNWLAAAAAVFILPDPNVRNSLGMAGGADVIILHLFALCVALFGTGYYWTSRDLARGRDVVKLGAGGKPFVFLIFMGHALAGNIPYKLAAPAIGDLVLGLLFLEFLIFTARIKQAL